jgi:hypothetical protein
MSDDLDDQDGLYEHNDWPYAEGGRHNVSQGDDTCWIFQLRMFQLRLLILWWLHRRWDKMILRLITSCTVAQGGLHADWTSECTRRWKDVPRRTYTWNILWWWVQDTLDEFTVFGSMHEFYCMWNGVGPPTSTFLERSIGRSDWTIRKGFSGGRLGTGHTEHKDSCRNIGHPICDLKSRLDNIDGFAPWGLI